MSGALDGLVALDLATFVAAPFCCTLLGEFGALVIKVEQPGRGDDLRRLGHKPADGVSYMWLVEARNKKSITCNLREPEGQALIKRLAAKADILAENFRPGTMEKWNLGYDELARANPGLVMVRISAFGQTGPSRERPGFGRIAGAVSGVSYISGYPDRPPVSPGTPTIPDYLAGAMGALGALAAIESRHRTGLGQVVDVALYEPMLRMMDEMIPVHAALGKIRERIGSGTEYVVPHNHYQARDGSWIAIACTNDRMFERLTVDAMGQPELRAEFSSMDERIRRRAGAGRARAVVGGRLRRRRGARQAGRRRGPLLARQQREGPLRRSPREGAREPRRRRRAGRRSGVDARRRAQAVADAGRDHERRPRRAGRAQRGDLLRPARPHEGRSRRARQAGHRVSAAGADCRCAACSSRRPTSRARSRRWRRSAPMR